MKVECRYTRVWVTMLRTTSFTRFIRYTGLKSRCSYFHVYVFLMYMLNKLKKISKDLNLKQIQLNAYSSVDWYLLNVEGRYYVD